MNFSHEKPPIYEKCHQIFGVNWDDGMVFTYGDTVYSKGIIPKDLEAHEGTHIKQQAEMGKDVWWERYFVDKDFRLSQEIEAYKNQIIYLNENCNRSYRKMIMKHIYKSMVKLYGDMCPNEEEARRLIDCV
jgi:hypothetical protein